MIESPTYYYATAIAHKNCGFLLRGIAGIGKSDLALRVFKCGGSLIADDQTILETQGNQVIARCPAPLQNRLEIRGIGVVDIETLAQHPIHAIVNLKRSEEIERLPKEHLEELQGVSLPVYELDARCPSAVDKIEILADILQNKRQVAEEAA